MLHSENPAEEIHPLTREDHTTFSPPPAFGPFRVLHQIGIGTLGPVFRTYEPTRDRLVAVKVFRLDIVPEQADALAAALRRAVEASLFHPSIVEPLDAAVEGTLAFRAEEYVAAESLDVAMRHYAPAPVEKVLPFITQLAGAIDFARAAGIGHGGLHPRDIFVTPDEARATGFGVVEALQSVGIRAPIRRPYAAPERIDGIKWGTAADVFSLGAIAFELLTARRPAGTGPQIGVISDSDQGRALHTVLLRAMDDDFSARYPTALAFAAALEEAGRASAAPSPVAIPVAAAATGAAARAPAAAPIEPAVVTPGEFEVEKELDPVLAALDEDISPERRVDAADPAYRSLFDEPLSIDEPLRREALDTDTFDDLNDEPERFADEFVEEQQAEAEARRPLEAVHETTASPRGNAPEPPMFGSADQGHESESVEYGERARPVILPVAV